MIMENNTFCYCKSLVEEPYMIKCQICKNSFHSRCVRTVIQAPLVGDIFYHLTCETCSSSGQEVLYRERPLTWVQAIILAMYNLQLKEAGKQGFFHWKDHICAFLGRHWNSFFGTTSKKRSATQWQGTVAGILSLYSGFIFKSGNGQLGENGWWGLIDPRVPSPAQLEVLVKSCHEAKRQRTKKAAMAATEEVAVPILEREEVVVCTTAAAPSAEVAVEPPTMEEEELWRPAADEDEDAREDLLNSLFNLEVPPEAMDLDIACPILSELHKTQEVPAAVKAEPSGWEILTPAIPQQQTLVSKSPPKDLPSPTIVFLSVYEEGLMLKRLEKLSGGKSDFLRRLQCKLAVRKRKRERNVPLFDLDAEINGTAPAPEPLRHYFLDRFQNPSCATKPVRFTHRLTGVEEEEPILSPYSCRTLEPCIQQDFQTRPIKLQLFQELFQKLEKKSKQPMPSYQFAPLTYSFVKPGHITAVNSICHQFFWPGIDMVDCLHYPEFSCIVQYKKLLVGFAFAVPDTKFNEVYIPFIFVHPEWRGSGLATFMLAHLLKESRGKDVTLHVSITNPSRALYEKFGFKVEQVYLDFYDKYFDHYCKDSRNAYYMRLSR